MKGGFVMDKYEILKLNNEPFDFLVIATSYENPLSHFADISKDIKVERARILFDLTLINGMKRNRYIACDFRLGESHLQSCSLINEIDEYIKSITHNYFMENEEVVQKSVIPNSLKFLLKSGMV